MVYPIMSEIRPRLFLGNHKSARQAKELGFTHVVNTLGSEFQFFSDIQYCTLDLKDDPSQEIFSCFDLVNEFIASALLKEDTKVLVHCWAGKSRSVTLIIAYLMFIEGILFCDAMISVEARHFWNISPNPGFVRQLLKYQLISKIREAFLEQDENKLECQLNILKMYN
jgi:atypical dual specificity phosphatase